MSAIRNLAGSLPRLDSGKGMMRIPPEVDVPLTAACGPLIDTAEFRRLARISQLGLVSLVYPAAIHTRFEHSLGVYRLALLFLRQLSYDRRFCGLGFAGRRRVVSGGGLAARPGTLAVLPSDRRHPACPACRSTSCSPTAFCWKAKSPTRCATTGASSRATWSRCYRASRATPRAGCWPACSPGRSTSTRWTTCTATACTPACPTAATSTSSG